MSSRDYKINDLEVGFDPISNFDITFTDHPDQYERWDLDFGFYPSFVFSSDHVRLDLERRNNDVPLKNFYHFSDTSIFIPLNGNLSFLLL